MAGEASHKKKGKLSRQESNRSGKGSEVEDKPIAGASSTQDKTSGGLRVYKIVVLGDGGVGKSGEGVTLCFWTASMPYFVAVTLQFVNHSFLDYHDPTIGNNYRVSVQLMSKHLMSRYDCRGFVPKTSRHRW
jgi:hypothetical protein